MVARQTLQSQDRRVSNYFAGPKTLEFIPSGCKILDLALGGGWIEDRIINIVGDKCLSGDTMVSVKRGCRPRKMTMRDLFSRIKGDHPNKSAAYETYLLSDVGGHVGMAKMMDIIWTGEKTLYEITTSRGRVIKASEDHQFSTAEGWMSLCEGMRLGTVVKYWRGSRGVSETRAQRNDMIRSVTYSIPFHPFGQRNVVAGRDYKRLSTARLVIEAAINGMTMPELISILRTDPATSATLQYTDPDMHVHHLDGNCSNDDLSNLQLITPEDHWRIHANEMPANTRAIELDNVVAINNIGKELTFDVTMEHTLEPNFIANGFVVHNSTGKTLLATEACANFAIKYPKGKIRYRECERAWDNSYAKAIGMPMDRVDFGDPLDTVEELFNDLLKIISKAHHPELCIVDSLDSLSDQAEMARGMEEGTYGTNKARNMSQLFRRLVRALSRSHVTLIIISQVRSKIGPTLGRKTTRSGGRALDFYASQVLYLSHIETISRTIKGVKRATGIRIRAKCDKNKVSLPFREADFPILFGYGIDDAESCIDWLRECKSLDLIGLKDGDAGGFLKDLRHSSNGDYHERMKRIHQVVTERWYAIEQTFLPTRKKYGL